MNSVLNLPNRVLWGIQITEELSVINPGHRKCIFRLLEMNFGPVQVMLKLQLLWNGKL